MNLTTKQLVFLAAHIDGLSQGAVNDPKARIEGRFSIELEWQEAGRGSATGQYILKGVHSSEAHR